MRLPDRISSKIRLGECWDWIACCDARGYGRVRWEGKTRFAHRVVYEIYNGTTELPLDHLCRNHSCVRPDHLEPVTHRENVLRGEGLAAHQARMEHCDKGHQFSIDKRGKRFCPDCKREYMRAWQAAHV